MPWSNALVSSADGEVGEVGDWETGRGIKSSLILRVETSGVLFDCLFSYRPTCQSHFPTVCFWRLVQRAPLPRAFPSSTSASLCIEHS